MSSPGPEGLRLDLFLKVSRLVKRRTVAQRLCRADAVLVGGQAAKCGQKVRPGDRIEIRHPNRWLRIEVVGLPRGNVTRETAAELFRILEQGRIDLMGRELPPGEETRA